MNERDIFIAALEKATAQERSEYLSATCAGDSALKLRVEGLLHTHEQAGAFLQKPLVERLAEGVTALEDEAETARDPSAPRKGGHDLGFLTPSNQPGSLGRLGHYEVQEVIGSGGMGIVLRAFDEKLHRVVAIKVLAAQLATNAAARKRFLREARAAAAVCHDHIVTIHAVEESGELPYLVMQCVPGMSLQERIDRDGPLALHEILRIGMQTAAGLAAAHAQGLMHRDIKPANILLENGVERVRITDFGLARAAADASVSQTGIVAGTPQYMAPEQARGEALDCRTDLFSLGSVLYAMCTGRAPFRAANSMAVLKRVCDNAPSPIREANADIPEWLLALIDKLQAKNPGDRCQTAMEVAEYLSQQLAQLQQPGRAGGVSLPVSRNYQGTDVPRSPLRRWAAAAAVLLFLAAGLGVTETTGTTQLTATVIRIFTPSGTLIVETDDPDVKVTIEGDGGLVITGAGLHKVRLKPGSYKLQATKDGQPAHTEMVTISKGQRKVVTVTLEPKGPQWAARGIRSFLGHTGTVWSVAITRDSRRIVSASQDGTARVWDTATGQEVSRFEGHELCVYCAAISPDGKCVLSGSGGKPDVGQADTRKWSICLWELETGKELKRLDGEPDQITSIALSADGSRALVGGYSGNVMLWDVDAWREIKRIPAAPRVWSVDLSPDESRIVTTSGYAVTSNGQIEKGCIQLWNLTNGQELQRFDGHELGVWKAVFSPSGNQIASTGGDKTIRLWNAQTGALEHRFTAREVTTSVAYSADGKYLLAGNYGVGPTVGLWNVETGKEIQSFAGHTLGVQSVAISQGGRWAVSGSHDSTVRMWELPAEVHQNVSPHK